MKPNWDDERQSTEVINLLRWQSEVNDRHSLRAQSRLDRIMAFSFTLLAGSATLVIHYRVYALAFLLPFVYSLATFLAIESFTSMVAHVAARDFADLQIYSAAKAPDPTHGLFAPWSVSGGAKTWSSIANLALQMLFGVGGCAVGYLSIILGCIEEHSLWWVGIPVGIAYSFIVVMAVLSAQQGLRAYGEVVDAMQGITGFDRRKLLAQLEIQLNSEGMTQGTTLPLESAHAPHRQAVFESVRLLMRVNWSNVSRKVPWLRGIRSSRD